MPGRGTVHAHGFADITIAGLEDAIVVVSMHVPAALRGRNEGQYAENEGYSAKGNGTTYAHYIVDVLAVGGGIRADACADAELARAHEVGPLVELLPGAKHIAVNETADGVAVPVGAVVVELAPLVRGGDVDLGEVALAGDLDVLGGLYEVDALEGALGYHAGAVVGLRAVGDHLAFGLADGVDSGRPPQAEVIDSVEPCIITD